jgi:hypothetical protein
MADQPGKLFEGWIVLRLRALPPLYRAGGNCPPPSGGASTWREKLTLAISNNLAHPELELVLHLAIAIY